MGNQSTINLPGNLSGNRADTLMIESFEECREAVFASCQLTIYIKNPYISYGGFVGAKALALPFFLSVPLVSAKTRKIVKAPNVLSAKAFNLSASFVSKLTN